MTFGIMMQVRKIRVRKSAADISISEVLLRTGANTVLLLKMLTTKDVALSVGSSIMWIAVVTLAFNVTRYQQRK